MTVSYGPLAVTCDGECGEEVLAEDVDAGDFYELKEAIDKDGWTTRRIDKKWLHFCPDCPPP